MALSFFGHERARGESRACSVEYLQVDFHLSGNVSSSFQELTTAKCRSWCFPSSKETFRFSHRRALTGALHPWQHQQGQTTQNPRILGWLGLEGTTGDRPVQPPAKAGPPEGVTRELGIFAFLSCPQRGRDLLSQLLFCPTGSVCDSINTILRHHREKPDPGSS